MDDMKRMKRYERLWQPLYHVAKWYILKKFKIQAETMKLPGPALIICNHVSNWDPLLVGLCFPKDQVSFVASEHLFRRGFVSGLIRFIVCIIARPKASGSTQTVVTCLKYLRSGHSVGLFAEGDATWNGITQPVFSATGKLAKNSGAYLVTMRSKGLYLADPRWSPNLRWGDCSIGAVKIYSPEELREMTAEEVTDAINRDIHEDTWEEQRGEPVSYTSEAGLTTRLESGLFLCPMCHHIGRMKGKGDVFACSCGMQARMLPTGFLTDGSPFETIAEWDAYQFDVLLKGVYKKEKDCLFSDEGAVLSEIERDRHRNKVLDRGRLRCLEDRIVIGDTEFLYAMIDDMSMVQTDVLLFTHQHHYYETTLPKGCCLRKYLAVWKEKHTA